MAIIRSKDMAKMNSQERLEKLDELKIELLKSKISNKKGGKRNIREIKKTVARLLTLNRIEEKQKTKEETKKMEKKETKKETQKKAETKKIQEKK